MISFSLALVSFHPLSLILVVAKAQKHVKKILENSRNPRLAEDEEHKYDDKYALAEFLTNTAVASEMNALERLGMDPEKLMKVSGWIHDDKKTATIRFQARDACSFLRETDVSVTTGEKEVETSTATSNTSTGFLGMTSAAKTETVKTKVVTKIKEYHWRVEVGYRIIVFPGTDAGQAIELDSRTNSTIIVTSGGMAGGVSERRPATPIPEKTDHPPVDADITWFIKMIDPKEQACQFKIDRNSVKALRTCKTPRRNDDVDAAFEFHASLYDWTQVTQGFFVQRVEREILGKHNPVKKQKPASTASPESVEAGTRGIIHGLTKEPSFNGKMVIICEYSKEQQRFRVDPVNPTDGLPPTLLVKPANVRIDDNLEPSLSGVSADSVFSPVVPLMENNSVLPMGEVANFLTEQCRSLDEVIDGLAKTYPPRQLAKLVSVAEATVILVCQHMQNLATCYQDGVDYVENMLQSQLVQAIGKEIRSKDFDQFIAFHSHRLFRREYSPEPFTFAVRRPDHFPDGVLTIECVRQKNEPIHTMKRLVSGKTCPPICMPINAATSIELSGDRYLHGWMQHRFKTKPKNEYQLVARARQFSSFMLVLGTMMGPGVFDPKDAIILQNKDEVLIPLLVNTLPSAKDFKDSIASLSPEQQAFAKSFRTMQLESSVFAVAVIQLKPQLEKVLGLPDGALTKEIQLTQDLMSLFVDYQIPTDLMSFDGTEEASVSAKLAAVRDHVKGVIDVIDKTKEKQLVEEERKADMRAEMNFDGMPPPAPFRGPFGDNSGPHAMAYGSAAPAGSLMTDQSEASAKSPKPDGRRMLRTKGTPNRAERSPVPRKKGALRAAPAHEADAFSMSSDPRSASAPSVTARAETVQPPSDHNDHVSLWTEEADFTVIPKILDDRMSRLDTDNALRSTIIKAGPTWQMARQENLLASMKTGPLSATDVEEEKKKAFDLLDAISRSGSLPIESSELHVVVGVAHCFDNDVMGSIIQDNINPIEKVERSALLIASTVYGQPPAMLVNREDEVQRLTSTFPALFSEDEHIEIYNDHD